MPIEIRLFLHLRFLDLANIVFCQIFFFKELKILNFDDLIDSVKYHYRYKFSYLYIIIIESFRIFSFKDSIEEID